MNEYQRALHESPSPTGVITYYLKVESTGRAAVLLKSDSIGNDDLAEKIRVILEQEDFGKAGDAMFEMALPVQLAPL